MLRRYYKSHERADVGLCKEKDGTGRDPVQQIFPVLREIPEELLGGHKELHKGKPTDRDCKKPDLRQGKSSFHSQAFGIKKPVQQFKVASGEGPGYDVGDRVRHMKFGEGLVTAITEGGRDYEVTVEFDTVGVKKMFAAFARLKKVE